MPWSPKMSPPARPSRIPLVIVAAISLVGSEIGHLVTVSVGNIGLPALWPPVGVLAAVLILEDRRSWKRLVPVAFGAMLLSAVVLHGWPALLSIGHSTVACLEALLVVSFIQRSTSGAFALNRLSHACALAGAATLVPLAGAALGAGMLALGGVSPFVATWRAWWLADVLGTALTVPLVIPAITERAALATVRSWKWIEIAVVFGGAIGLAANIFGEGLNPLVRVPAYILPFLLWPVFRFGPGGTAAMLFVISMIGLWNAGQGLGPLAMVGAPADSLILRSQGAMVIATGSFLLLASVVAERKRVAQEYASLVAGLQQALAEIKTLRGFIPICAWCHKIRDDAGFWQQIEEYLDARTDATFSHSICPECEQLAHGEVEGHDELPGRVS